MKFLSTDRRYGEKWEHSVLPPLQHFFLLKQWCSGTSNAQVMLGLCLNYLAPFTSATQDYKRYSKEYWNVSRWWWWLVFLFICILISYNFPSSDFCHSPLTLSSNTSCLHKEILSEILGLTKCLCISNWLLTLDFTTTMERTPS